MLRRVLIAVIFGSCAQICNAQDLPAAADEQALRQAVTRAVTGFIEPSLERFAHEAQDHAQAAAELCREPSAQNLDHARDRYAALVLGWARIGFFKLPPFVEGNRSERVLFWPDPRGVTQRQVQRALAAKDPSVGAADSLSAKSVALQGLGALEFVYFGGGADQLAGLEGAHRCAYAAAIAVNLEHLAAHLAGAFAADGQFARQITQPGSDNPLYRSGAEAAEDLLNDAASGVEVVRDFMLKPAMGETAATANAKVPPFWRSNLAVRFMQERVSGVAHLIEIGGFSGALPQDERWIERSLILEFETAAAALGDMGEDLRIAVADNDGRDAMRRALLSLLGLRTLLGETLPQGLGLEIGFNALDGD